MISIRRSLFTALPRMTTLQCKNRSVCFSTRKMQVEDRLRAQGILTKAQGLESFLQRNNLCGKQEKVEDVFERASTFLAEAGTQFYGPIKAEEYKKRFMDLASRFEVIYGSPILTNAGRRHDKSVSACSIPKVRLSSMSREEIKKIVSSYHTLGMGTGFSLDDVEEPVEMVKYLNEIAIKEVQSGLIERSVGNMGVLSINHPKVLSFIRVREKNSDVKEWKFNLSVNITNDFIDAWLNNTPFILKDGSTINAADFMRVIAESAHRTGDPGLIFMDRINDLNKLPQMGSFKTVVPCGEVSLYEGEVCQFAYLNLFHFIRDGKFDVDRLREVVHLMVVMLDNAVEANVKRMPSIESSNIISSVRRIGIGVCGFAETLQELALPYDSWKGRNFAENLMSLINFESKRASIQLAKDRGPFSAFSHSETREDLFIGPFMKYPTDFVTKEDWKKLEKEFRVHKIRNLSTTILPPTGRSSLIGGVTSSIEPPFVLASTREVKEGIRRLSRNFGYTGCLEDIFGELEIKGNIQHTDLPETVKKVFKTALDISPYDHLNMTAAFQRHVDDGISKTINMPSNASVEDVLEIFALSIRSGLKGLTIYRDGSRTLQPRELSGKKGVDTNTMTITDSIYKRVPVSQRVISLIQSPLVQRLGNIRQNGAHFLVDPRFTTTRLEHSIGALALANILGASEEEQIAALLHDVTHTALSHVGDIVFNKSNQDYHNTIAKQFFAQENVQEILSQYGIKTDALVNERYFIVKGDGLNVDRIDYIIRDLLQAGKIFHPEYSSILNNLVIKDGNIRCKDIDTAYLFFRKSLQANREIYFDPKAEVANHIIGAILRSLLEEGEIRKEDFEKTDAHLLGLIEKSRFNKIFKQITPELKIEIVDPHFAHIVAKRKLRYVDPQIIGVEGTLTDNNKEAREALREYLETPTTVGYRCSILEELV